MTERAFHLKTVIQNQTEALSEVGDFKWMDSPLKEERRNERNAETRCELPTTKSGRCDQRCCRVVWLLFNEPGGSSFKANVSHCYQEVTISRTRDLYCHRVCMLRDYIALGLKVHDAA